MSRKSQRKRNKRREKNRGKNQNADVFRKPSKRKLCRSSKKKARRLNRNRCHCAVCLETIRSRRKEIDCGHIYHKKCINDWARKSSPTCPLCKKTYKYDTRGPQLSNPDTRPESRSLIIRISRRSLRIRIDLPVFFFPVICCRCQLDSNDQPEENHTSNRIFFEALAPLRGSLRNFDYTLIALNSPEEAGRNPLNNPYRRYIYTDEIPSTPTDATTNPLINTHRECTQNPANPSESSNVAVTGRVSSTNIHQEFTQNDETRTSFRNLAEVVGDVYFNSHRECTRNAAISPDSSTLADTRCPLTNTHQECTHNTTNSLDSSTLADTRSPLTITHRECIHNTTALSGSLTLEDSSNRCQQCIHMGEILYDYFSEAIENRATNPCRQCKRINENILRPFILEDARRNPLPHPYQQNAQNVLTLPASSTLPDVNNPLTNPYRGYNYDGETLSESASIGEGEIDLRSFYALNSLHSETSNSRNPSLYNFWEYIRDFQGPSNSETPSLGEIYLRPEDPAHTEAYDELDSEVEINVID